MSPSELPPYQVMCYAPGCPNEAAYKIAARWSDGVTSELKTYSLSCRGCVTELFRAAGVKKAECRLAARESLGEPEVFELTRGRRDRELARRRDLEATSE